MNTASVLLFAAYVSAIIAAALLPFPIIGLLGLPLFVVSFVCFLAAAVFGRSRKVISLSQRMLGLSFYVVGAIFLVTAAGYHTLEAAEHALRSQGINIRYLSSHNIEHLFILSPLLIAIGLRYWTQWF